MEEKIDFCFRSWCLPSIFLFTRPMLLFSFQVLLFVFNLFFYSANVAFPARFLFQEQLLLFLHQPTNFLKIKIEIRKNSMIRFSKVQKFWLFSFSNNEKKMYLHKTNSCYFLFQEQLLLFYAPTHQLPQNCQHLLKIKMKIRRIP